MVIADAGMEWKARHPPLCAERSCMRLLSLSMTHLSLSLSPSLHPIHTKVCGAVMKKKRGREEGNIQTNAALYQMSFQTKVHSWMKIPPIQVWNSYLPERRDGAQQSKACRKKYLKLARRGACVFGFVEIWCKMQIPLHCMALKMLQRQQGMIINKHLHQWKIIHRGIKYNK